MTAPDLVEQIADALAHLWDARDLTPHEAGERLANDPEIVAAFAEAANTLEGTTPVSAGRGESAATDVPKGTPNPQVAPDARTPCLCTSTADGHERCDHWGGETGTHCTSADSYGVPCVCPAFEAAEWRAPQRAPDARPRVHLPAWITDAHARNAFAALGIPESGTFASVLITPSSVTVVDIPGGHDAAGRVLAGTRSYPILHPPVEPADMSASTSHLSQFRAPNNPDGSCGCPYCAAAAAGND